MNDTKADDAGVILMKSKNSEILTMDPGIALKTRKNGDGPSVGVATDHVVQRLKVDRSQERQPSDLEPDRPTKPACRPWVWALLGVAVLVGIGGGVALLSLLARL